MRFCIFKHKKTSILIKRFLDNKSVSIKFLGIFIDDYAKISKRIWQHGLQKCFSLFPPHLAKFKLVPIWHTQFFFQQRDSLITGNRFVIFFKKYHRNNKISASPAIKFSSGIP